MGQESKLGKSSRLREYVALSYQRAREGHLPVWRQLVEMLGLMVLTGNGPGVYHLSGFWRRTVPWTNKLSYLSHSAYHKKANSLNSPAFRKLSQHKLVESGLLTLVGFPKPAFIGFMHGVKGRTADGKELRTADDLRRLIDSQQLKRFCVKLVQGWAGRGFEIVEPVYDDGRLRLRLSSTGQIVEVEEFVRRRADLEKGGGSVIEDCLVQHPRMAAFNPSSVNTYRIWVIEGADGRGYPRLAYLRIGRAGSLVDNQSAGGIVAPVDMEKGILGEALDGLYTRKTFAAHPDHGAPIKGEIAPLWSESVKIAQSALELFPGLKFAGLDIAVSVDGPVILELNPVPDRIGAAFVDVPSKWALSEPTGPREP